MDSQYDPEFAGTVRNHLRGLPDIGQRPKRSLSYIATFLDVPEIVVREWLFKHREFRDACEFDLDTFDQQAELSLHMQACGYHYYDERVIVCGREAHKVNVKKFQPPNLDATLLWLVSKNPDKWQAAAVKLGLIPSKTINSLNDAPSTIPSDEVLHNGKSYNRKELLAKDSKVLLQMFKEM